MGDEYTRSTKYYQDRALEQTISHGFSSLADAELNLSRQLSRDLNDAIARNQKTQNDASRLIVEELRYQKQHFDANADRIINAIEIAGIQSVGAIEALGRYLGDKLSHISYQMELMTGIGQQIVYLLLNSLDNESRQYLEQGLKAFGQREFEIAKERFFKALEANSTNDVVYQHIGLIAVSEGSSDVAIRNFELAEKFPSSEYHKALSQFHLASIHKDLGQLADARTYIDAAAQNSGEGHPWFYYEQAKICALQIDKEYLEHSLFTAIIGDPVFYVLPETDSEFESVPNTVARARTHAKEIIQGYLNENLVKLNLVSTSLSSLIPTLELFCRDALESRTLSSTALVKNMKGIVRDICSSQSEIRKHLQQIEYHLDTCNYYKMCDYNNDVSQYTGTCPLEAVRLLEKGQSVLQAEDLSISKAIEKWEGFSRDEVESRLNSKEKQKVEASRYSWPRTVANLSILSAVLMALWWGKEGPLAWIGIIVLAPLIGIASAWVWAMAKDHNFSKFLSRLLLAFAVAIIPISYITQWQWISESPHYLYRIWLHITPRTVALALGVGIVFATASGIFHRVSATKTESTRVESDNEKSKLNIEQLLISRTLVRNIVKTIREEALKLREI